MFREELECQPTCPHQNTGNSLHHIFSPGFVNSVFITTTCSLRDEPLLQLPMKEPWSLGETDWASPVGFSASPRTDPWSHPQQAHHHLWNKLAQESESPGNLHCTAPTQHWPHKSPCTALKGWVNESTLLPVINGITPSAPCLKVLLALQWCQRGAEVPEHYSALKPLIHPTPLQRHTFGFISFLFCPVSMAHLPSVLFQNVTRQERALKKPQLWSLQLFHNIQGTPIIADRQKSPAPMKWRQV